MGFYPSWYVFLTSSGGEAPTGLLSCLTKCCLMDFSVRRYGGLNEDGPHRLRYLNVWFPVDGTAWKGLNGAPLLETVFH